MVRKKVTGMLCCLVMLMLACGTLFAQSKPRMAHTNLSKNITLAQGFAAPQTIFSNLGPTPTNLYNATTGYYLLGPTNGLGFSEQWIALPFTPKAAAHVTQIAVAAGYISGTKQIIVGLYSDNAGTVGTLLASATVINMGNFGTCCQLAFATIPSTAVSAGTQYWIGVTSDDVNAPDFAGVFESSNTANTAADVAQGGWFSFSNNWPAGAVRGTIP